MHEVQKPTHDAKELAYLYDLYIVPQWREAFDRIVDHEVPLPEEGKFLDASCGTGGYALDLAVRGGAKTHVLGIDASEDRLELARGKAEVQKIDRVAFQQGFPLALGVPDEEFDLVIGDSSFLPPAQISEAFEELARVAKPGATVAMKLLTRGSFDEFFSIYWEALYDLELTEYSPELERMITERFTVTGAEALAAAAGLKRVRSVTRKERFDYASAAGFFDAPLIEANFLDEWLAILPDEDVRRRVQQEMASIIDGERHEMDFDVSIKATVVIGEK